MCKWLCLLILLFAGSVEPKLLMVSTVFGPGSEVPYVVIKQKEWNSIGKGQVSPAGLRSQYLLGLDFSKKYQELLKDELTPSLVDYAYHQTTVNVQSAHAFVTGSFRSFPGKTLQFPNDDDRLFSQAGHTFDLSEITYNTPLPFGYIPVELEGKNDPEQIRILPSACKTGLEIQKMAYIDLKKNIEGANFTEKLGQTIQKVLTKYDYKKESKMYEANDVRTCVILASYAISDYFNTPDSNFELDDQDMIELRNCYSANMAGSYMDKDLVRTMVSPLLLTIKDAFENRVKGNNSFKLNYYSLRQEVLFNIAQVAGVVNNSCIFEDFYQQKNSKNCWKPVGQSLSFTWELHEMDSDPGIYFVRTKLNDSPINFCQITTGADADFDCGLSEFINKLEELTRKDFAKWCNPSDEKEGGSKKVKSRFWQFFTFIMLFLILILGGIGYFGLKEIVKQRSPSHNLPDRPSLDFKESTASL